MRDFAGLHSHYLELSGLSWKYHVNVLAVDQRKTVSTECQPTDAGNYFPFVVLSRFGQKPVFFLEKASVVEFRNSETHQIPKANHQHSSAKCRCSMQFAAATFNNYDQ